MLGNHQRSCWQLVAYSRCSPNDGDFLKDKVSLGEEGGLGWGGLPGAKGCRRFSCDLSSVPLYDCQMCGCV